MKDIKVEIESIIQFAIALIAIVGLFLTKPAAFDLYSHGAPFLAGDPGVYLMFLVTVVFILLSLTYNKPLYTKYWLIAMLGAGILFSILLNKYNSDLRAKTFLAASVRGPKPVRIIKGTNYRKTLKESCPLFNSGEPVKEFEVIQQCADLADWSEIDKIWPKEEIESNANQLLATYYLCLLLGGISLISGVQAIKCKRNTNQ